MSAPLFNDYLIHFCGKNKTPRQAQAVLESILKRGRFIPSRCPLFADPGRVLERRHLQAWANMVCFTDLRFQDLEHHVHKFGPYGLAIKKHSPPARKMDPVHYVEVGSTAQRVSHKLTDGIRHLRELQERGKIDKAWEFPRLLKEFDDARVATMQDIKTRDENEWRYISLAEEDVLTFGPSDVRFLLVETWDQAVRWNRRLSKASEKHLRPYGKAGVLALPVELLVGPGATRNGKEK